MTEAMDVVTPEVPLADTALVILCSDVAKGRSGDAIVERLRGSSESVNITVVSKLCVAPWTLTAIVRNAVVDRVIIACRVGTEVRDEVVARVRRAGVHPSGVRVLELKPGEMVGPNEIAADSVVRIEAALARTRCGDASAPIRERALANSVLLSRRNLFRPGAVERSAVATWSESGDADLASSFACIDSCPVGALSVDGRRLVVDEARCTGCGACVRACRSGAVSLAGVSLRAYEAEAAILAKCSADLHSRPGVAIVCAHAQPTMLLGDDRLPLEVPSLEIVSVGWLVQILAAGASVSLVACGDERCVTRGDELIKLAHALAQAAAPGFDVQFARGMLQVVARESLGVRRALERAPLAFATLRFDEPDATTSAMAYLRSASVASGALASPIALVAPALASQDVLWSVESPWLALGDVAIDESRCTACGRCVPACAAHALEQRDEPGGAVVLTFDPSACSACAACVFACPQDALQLRHVFDFANLSAPRHSVFVRTARPMCASCGGDIAGGLVPSAIATRLDDSHPRLAQRLRSEVRCADCLLAL